jgi:hypothetical protein
VNAVGDEIFTLKCRGLAGSVFSAVLGAALWFAILKICAPLPAALGVCGFGITLNLALIVRQLYGKRIVFDSKARTITIGRLFSGKTVVAFDGVARIAPITYRNLLFTYEAFCVIRAASPITDIRIITPMFRLGGKQLADFRNNTLPKLEKILRPEPAGFKKNSGVSRSRALRYEKNGTRRTKSFRRGLLWISALSMTFILLPAAAPFFIEPDRMISAALLSTALLSAIVQAIALYIPVKSVSFDINMRTLEITKGLLGWGGVSSYPFSSVKSLRVSCYTSRWDGNGNKNLSLCVEGLKKPLAIIPYTSKNREIADELGFLADMLGLDPVYDITYTQFEPNNSLLEVL